MPHTAKILQTKSLTHDVIQLTVQKPKNYIFTPGQATLVAINKKGWEDNFHPFTFTSLTSEPHLEFIIKTYPLSKYPDHSGMTEKVGTLTKGDELLVKDPWGTIKYQRPGIFIAGGAGITPFVAIFRDLAKQKKSNKNTLFFSNKTKKDVILHSELKKNFRKNLKLLFTKEGDPRIDKEYLQNNVDDFNQHFYVCGPKQMVKDLKEALNSLGAKTSQLVFEK